MQVLLINNPYDKNSVAFKNEFVEKYSDTYDISVVNFMQVRDVIHFQNAPCVIFYNNDFTLEENRLAVIDNIQDMDDFETRFAEIEL